MQLRKASHGFGTLIPTGVQVSIGSDYSFQYVSENPFKNHDAGVLFSGNMQIRKASHGFVTFNVTGVFFFSIGSNSSYRYVNKKAFTNSRLRCVVVDSN